jgi:hypothetical protein
MKPTDTTLVVCRALGQPQQGSNRSFLAIVIPVGEIAHRERPCLLVVTRSYPYGTICVPDSFSQRCALVGNEPMLAPVPPRHRGVTLRAQRLHARMPSRVWTNQNADGLLKVDSNARPSISALSDEHVHQEQTTIVARVCAKDD